MQAYTSIYSPIQAHTSLSKPIQVYASVCKSMQAYSSQYKPIEVDRPQMSGLPELIVHGNSDKFLALAQDGFQALEVDGGSGQIDPPQT